jgi:ABC-2 type transport system ATP-binding protein
MSNTTSPVVQALVQAQNLTARYDSKVALADVSFQIPPGRVVGLLGHNGAGKSTLMKAMVGLLPVQGQLSVLGRNPQQQRTTLLHEVSYIPDVAVLPRWARVNELIELMQGLHPRFSAQRARTLLARTSVDAKAKVASLSKGMMAQVHLALVAAIDARLMILDEPTLGLDVLSRKAFYEMLIDEWCEGERSVLISTHQVEEVETLLSDVIMLNEGKLVLSLSLEAIEQRYTAVSHDERWVQQVEAAHPLLRYRAPSGGPAALFDGPPPLELAEHGQRLRPNLVDLFMALTRRPEINRTQF